MENEKEISVIIPIYNTPNEIFCRTIESVLKQSFDNYELIVIDDGSKKECADYIDNIKKKSDKIKVWHRANEGVSSARNFGISMANGKYVMFLDADDIVVSWLLESLYEIAEKTESDMVIGGIKAIKENEISSINKKKEKINFRVLNDKEKDDLKKHFVDLSINEFSGFSDGGYINRGVYARLIKRELAEKYNFPIGVSIGEDIIWNLNLISENMKIAAAFNIYYYYIQYEFSAVHRFRETIVMEREKLCSEVLKMLGKEEKYRNCIYNLMLENINAIIQNYLMNPLCQFNHKEKKEFLNRMLGRYPWNYIYEEYEKRDIKLIFYKNGWIISLYPIEKFLMYIRKSSWKLKKSIKKIILKFYMGRMNING